MGFSKSQGGLGFKDLTVFNQAFLANTSLEAFTESNFSYNSDLSSQILPLGCYWGGQFGGKYLLCMEKYFGCSVCDFKWFNLASGE
jgi:hypothetical protein